MANEFRASEVQSNTVVVQQNIVTVINDSPVSALPCEGGYFYDKMG